MKHCSLKSGDIFNIIAFHYVVIDKQTTSPVLNSNAFVHQKTPQQTRFSTTHQVQKREYTLECHKTHPKDKFLCHLVFGPLQKTTISLQIQLQNFPNKLQCLPNQFEKVQNYAQSSKQDNRHKAQRKMTCITISPHVFKKIRRETRITDRRIPDVWQQSPKSPSP
jgi:hypothetical protein